MKVIDWRYRNSQESVIEATLEDSCGNRFKGLLEIKVYVKTAQ